MSRKSFSDQLIELESSELSLKEAYEAKVHELMFPKPTRLEKYGNGINLLLGLFFLILFGTIAIVAPKEFTWVGRGGFILGAVFGVIVLVLSIYSMKKERKDKLNDELGSAGLAWGFIILMSTYYLVMADHFPDPSRLLTSMVIFEIPAAMALLKAYQHRSETRTKKKLLEIEYQIAKLAESIQK
ncbi:MAG: hypothetical protein HQ515_14060 [Phycisphaeraceae bacterium]|nr:hypothetical protein [Phycisphaeraceae bacterium]